MAEFKYNQWIVQRSARKPLLDFILRGLELAGCTVIYASDPGYAPFYITFENLVGERHGILVYAFLANSRITKNRPIDEHRFQIKYGGDKAALLPVEQDRSGLVTSLFVGIDLERNLLVGADPIIYDQTRMFISLEFKRAHADAIRANGWHAWERDSVLRRNGDPIQVLVGATQDRLLDFIRFERLARGLDAGHRQLLAEHLFSTTTPPPPAPHALTREFNLSESTVLDLIQSTSRLKMAVRGWVAEHHLADYLSNIPGVSECRRLEGDGLPDIELRIGDGPRILIECKNVLRQRASDGNARVDFQRTRASKSNPCSRYYQPTDFHILAACLHAVTEKWEYQFIPTHNLPSHPKCPGRLSSNVRVNDQWLSDPLKAISLLRILHD